MQVMRVLRTFEKGNNVLLRLSRRRSLRHATGVIPSGSESTRQLHLGWSQLSSVTESGLTERYLGRIEFREARECDENTIFYGVILYIATYNATAYRIPHLSERGAQREREHRGYAKEETLVFFSARIGGHKGRSRSNFDIAIRSV